MTTFADRYKNFSIELDCWPGNPRPWHLIEGVLKGTGLTVDDFDTAAPFFGNQTWVLKVGDEARDQRFVAAKPTIAMRVENLYTQGTIRYGSW